MHRRTKLLCMIVVPAGCALLGMLWRMYNKKKRQRIQSRQSSVSVSIKTQTELPIRSDANEYEPSQISEMIYNYDACGMIVNGEPTEDIINKKEFGANSEMIDERNEKIQLVILTNEKKDSVEPASLIIDESEVNEEICKCEMYVNRESSPSCFGTDRIKTISTSDYDSDGIFLANHHEVDSLDAGNSIETCSKSDAESDEFSNDDIDSKNSYDKNERSGSEKGFDHCQNDQVSIDSNKCEDNLDAPVSDNVKLNSGDNGGGLELNSNHVELEMDLGNHIGNSEKYLNNHIGDTETALSRDIADSETSLSNRIENSETALNSDIADSETPLSNNIENSALSSDITDSETPLSHNIENSALSSDIADSETALSSNIADSETPLSNNIENSALSSDIADSETPLSHSIENSETALSSDIADSETSLSNRIENSETALSSDIADSETPLSNNSENSALSSDIAESETPLSNNIENSALSSDIAESETPLSNNIENSALSSDIADSETPLSHNIENSALSSDIADSETPLSSRIENSETALSTSAENSGTDLNNPDTVGSSRTETWYEQSISAVDEAVENGSSEEVEMIVHMFDFPSHLCGRFIGHRGHNVTKIRDETGVEIRITQKVFTRGCQLICLKGTQPQITKALSILKKRFPQKKYPEIDFLTCTPDEPPTSVPSVMKLSLPSGIPLEVHVSNVVTPNHVFLQQPLHPSYLCLQKLSLDLTTVYENGTEIPSVQTPLEVGTICVVRFEGHWFRAEIATVYPDLDSCDVRLVDHGGYYHVNVNDLKQIRLDFMSIPFQAIECFLANVFPLDGDEDFSPEAKSTLEELVCGQLIQATVVDYTEDNNTPLVQLTRQFDNRVLLINQVLVDRGVAQWTFS